MPGSGDYLRNREYEFFPNESEEFEMDERYIYVWTIYEEQDDGADAVALGKATLECDEFPHIAKITFLTRGLFTEMEEKLIALLGGRAAEKIALNDISTGASNDIEK